MRPSDVQRGPGGGLGADRLDENDAAADSTPLASKQAIPRCASCGRPGRAPTIVHDPATSRSRRFRRRSGHAGLRGLPSAADQRKVGMSALAPRTTFSTSRLLEFCSRKELVAQTGHEPDDWPLVIIKELIENSLDSAEEAGVAPVIHVTIARGRIRVRDNGPGIPPETVASILDFTTRTSSREAYVAPDRGRQGNHREHPAAVKTGTTITVHWPESACSDPADAGPRFLPLVERVAYLNPHLTIYATWVDEEQRERLTPRATAPGWIKWTPAAPTCPHWYRRAEFRRLLGAFLTHDRQHKSVRLLRDFLAEFNGLSGTAKRKAVLDAVGLQRAPLERLLNGGMEFDHDLVDRLLAAMQAVARPIKPDGLGALGKDTVALSFESARADLSTFRYKILKGVTGWRAVGCRGRVRVSAGQPATSPLWDQLVAGTSGRRRSLQPGLSVRIRVVRPRRARRHPRAPDLPAARVPRSRQEPNLARHSPGFDAIRVAVESVTGDWERQRKSEIRDRAREQKRLERMRAQHQAPEASLKDLVLKHLPTVVRKISEGGRLSFTQRDVFYGIRPLVQQEQEKSLYYGYFTSLITDYENEHGEIAGMQREARGTLYHPHLRQEIPLSTESVAKYHRPFWTFNKMVYIEKAGTQQNLIEVGWPEEFDCAIASVAGFTTRAIKDLVDLLANSTEPVTVFCVHDADAAGTMIYHTLQNETKARGARKVEIVNLGLEPCEGVGMGLEVEAVEGTDRNRPVAPYVTEHDAQWHSWLASRGCESWGDWLQSYRIELNAMPPADRIAWITQKIEQYPPRKVIPPSGHTLPELREKAQAFVRSELTDELTRRAAIDERVAAAMGSINWSWPKPETVTAEIEQALEAAPHCQWSEPLHSFARRIATPLARQALADLDEESLP
jgi:hypothetical protein